MLVQYLDSDGSGTHTTCTTDNTGVLSTLYQWLTANNRQALLSETVSFHLVLGMQLLIFPSGWRCGLVLLHRAQQRARLREGALGPHRWLHHMVRGLIRHHV
jgi:hypothetical protein